MTPEPRANCARRPPTELLTELARGGLVHSSDRGPIVDSRGMLGRPALRDLILGELAEHVGEVPVDVIAGIANSGTPWALLLSVRLGLPFVNILVDGPRIKGLCRQLEPGDCVDSANVIVVDNWVESGASIRVAARLLQGAGALRINGLTVSANPIDAAALPIPLHVAFPFADLVRLRGMNHTEKETRP